MGITQHHDDHIWIKTEYAIQPTPEEITTVLKHIKKYYPESTKPNQTQRTGQEK